MLICRRYAVILFYAMAPFRHAVFHYFRYFAATPVDAITLPLPRYAAIAYYYLRCRRFTFAADITRYCHYASLMP
jgi:hypothetical protein